MDCQKQKNQWKRFYASTNDLSFSSNFDKQKSLFTPKNSALSKQSSISSKNVSLKSIETNNTNLNTSIYSRKITSASAYLKRDFNQLKSIQAPVRMRPSSSLSNLSTISDKTLPESNESKRILQSMNQFSNDIKILSLVQDKKMYDENELNLDHSIMLTTPTMPCDHSIAFKNHPLSPSMTKQLQIPTISQLLKMKWLRSNTERVREISSRSDSFLNQCHEFKLPSSDNNLTKNLQLNTQCLLAEDMENMQVHLSDTSDNCVMDIKAVATNDGNSANSPDNDPYV